ncbi:MAG: hypothetical protein E2O84_04065 [Bacteroidetes bacterium]|nr:MAG: hypothetical protein E2O84_04065 [Bacteroidota bacterium]
MKRTDVIFATTLLCAICLSASSWADELTIYPKGGQSPEQQEKDKFECYSWAKNESGFDPMAPPTATEAPPQQQAQRGGVVRGAARGAALGAIIDDSSEGARTGAKAGAAIGGMRRADQKRKQAQAQQQWEQEQQQIYAEKRNRYNKAYSVCLEAHDYAVK